MKRSMKKPVLITLVALLLIAGLFYSQRSVLTAFIMDRGLEQRLGQSIMDELADGLHVVLCGAGGPMPDPKRSGPCAAVIAGKTLVVVDSGTGGSRNLTSMQIPQGSIDALLLTHFHSDHIDGLGEMAMNRWVTAANTRPVPVIGPPGVKAVVAGFNQSYAQDAVYRHAHHTDLVAPLSGKGMRAVETVLPAKGESNTVFEKEGLVVTQFQVDHDPVKPSVGYRFDYKGRSVLISGDTAKSATVEKMARGVDVLVHEALSKNMVTMIEDKAKSKQLPIIEKIMFDILDYHTSPTEAAEIAAAAKVKYLLYYHVTPAMMFSGMDNLFLEGVSDIYSGPVTIGVDGSAISLPADSDAIEYNEWM